MAASVSSNVSRRGPQLSSPSSISSIAVATITHLHLHQQIQRVNVKVTGIREEEEEEEEEQEEQEEEEVNPTTTVPTYRPHQMVFSHMNETSRGVSASRVDPASGFTHTHMTTACVCVCVRRRIDRIT